MGLVFWINSGNQFQAFLHRRLKVGDNFPEKIQKIVINTSYIRKRLNRFERLLDLEAPDIIIQNELRLVIDSIRFLRTLLELAHFSGVPQEYLAFLARDKFNIQYFYENIVFFADREVTFKEIPKEKQDLGSRIKEIANMNKDFAIIELFKIIMYELTNVYNQKFEEHDLHVKVLIIEEAINLVFKLMIEPLDISVEQTTQKMIELLDRILSILKTNFLKDYETLKDCFELKEGSIAPYTKYFLKLLFDERFKYFIGYGSKFKPAAIYIDPVTRKHPKIVIYEKEASAPGLDFYVVRDKNGFAHHQHEDKSLLGLANSYSGIILLVSEDEMTIQHEIQHMFDALIDLKVNEVEMEYLAHLAEIAFSYPSAKEVKEMLELSGHHKATQKLSDKLKERSTSTMIVGAQELLEEEYGARTGLTYSQIIRPFVPRKLY